MSNREFSIKVLFNQLETRIDFNDFSNLPDNELEKITERYVKKSKIITKYYSQIDSTNVFFKFKKSILAYLEEERKRMQILIDSINKEFEPMKKIIEQQSSVLKLLQSRLPKIPIIKIPKIALPDLSYLKILNNSFLKVFEEQAKLWQNFALQYKKISKKSLQNLKKYKWFINSSIPATFIAETTKVKNAKEMRELFIYYHTHNNCEILFQNLEKWKSNIIFKKRIKLLSDAINLFNKEWKNNDININNIIIPLLINQIEGIRKDFLKSKGYVEIGHNQWQDPITKQTPSWKKIFKNQFKNPDEFTDWISTIFIEILFGNQTSNSIITWNRHKISHGETSRYGRLGNTIRCFMILDFLSELS